MKISRITVVLVLAGIFLPGLVLAQGSTLADKLADTPVILSVEIGGCDADRAILCPGLPANSQKSFMCLMAYEDNLSDSCRLGIVEAALALELGAMALKYSIEACEADADKFCMDVQPGEGRIVECLRSKESDLQASCVTALKETGLWNLGVE